MQQLFLEILNMSITATYCLVAVVLLRLLLKKLPKIYSYVLWAVVFFRMACPVSIKSAFSLLKPGARFMNSTIDSGSTVSSARYNFGAISDVTNGSINANNVADTSSVAESISALGGEIAGNIADTSELATNNGTTSSWLCIIQRVNFTNHIQTILTVAAIVWFVVFIGLLVYSIISSLRLKKKLRNSVHFEANIYESDNISTPFVFGIIKPKIYIPANLSEAERSFVLKHELTHIRRKDYIIKPLAFFIVCLHWFNPFAWMAFYLMSKDMEMSCDESVIGKLSRQETADYSQTLLAIAAGKKFLGASPLAFSEGNVKDRIKNVLKFKKPVAWVTGLIVAVLVAVIAGLSLNPKDSSVTESSITAAESSAAAEELDYEHSSDVLNENEYEQGEKDKLSLYAAARALDKSYRGHNQVYYDLSDTLIAGSRLEMANNEEDYDLDRLIKVSHFKQRNTSLYCYETEMITLGDGEEWPTDYNLVLEHDGVYQVFKSDCNIYFSGIFDRESLEPWVIDRPFDNGFEMDYDADNELELVQVIEQNYGFEMYEEDAIVVFDYNDDTDLYDMYYMLFDDFSDMKREAAEQFIVENYGAYTLDEHGRYLFDDGYVITYADDENVIINEDGTFDVFTRIWGYPWKEVDGTIAHIGDTIGSVTVNVSYIGNGKFRINSEKYEQFD